MTSLPTRLFVMLQHLLPKYLLTALVARVAAIRIRTIKNFLIRHFARIYDVDVGEAAESVPDGFDSFNHFFTRELVEGARPVDGAAASVVSPVDGTVSAAGPLDADMLLQAKGRHYSLADLLLTDIDVAGRYANGDFATFYLAPSNYHRVHCPLDATLVAARYIPGALFSVNRGTVEFLPNLFTRNERLVCHFDGAAGPLIVVLVGALNVGSISTPWTGRIRPRRKGVVQDLDLTARDHDRRLRKGDLLGWFNMGSTVIVLLPPATCSLSPAITPGAAIRMGQSMGTLLRAGP